MLDLQSLVRDWFNKSPHTKWWLLDNTQFIARGPRSQKGYIFIEHDGIDSLRWHQYNDDQQVSRYTLKAADPQFFDKLDKLLTDILL